MRHIFKPGRLLLLALTLSWLPAALPQTDFKIVWVVIGEAAASAGDDQPGVGRLLFTASELADLSLQKVTIARIDAQPVVNELTVGTRVCITSLKILAYDAKGATVKHAPLSISIRQDHKELLSLTRSKDDICVEPSVAGEYPMRFTSLLPAKDGTMRGAQIFLRVKE